MTVLHCLGLNHRTAPIALRETVALDELRLQGLLVGCTGFLGTGMAQAEGLVVLSTCNRVEVYAVLPTADSGSLRETLVAALGLDDSVAGRHLYHLMGAEAARHLMQVAAGLDSPVVGEPQILGQVAEAHLLAQRLGAAGPYLNRLFQSAVHAGKRARTETLISHNPSSVSSVAVELAASEVADLARARVLVIGAGEMAELVVEALRKRHVSSIVVVNRTAVRAHELAVRLHAEACTFAELATELQAADIVISSTGAPHTIVQAGMLRQARQRCADRKLVIIDIAMPRDVEPEVGQLPGVRLFDLDQLQERAETSRENRLREAPRVRAILEEELTEFLSWWESRALTPIVAGIHQKAEAIRQREVTFTLRRLPGLDERARQRIEALSRALVKKLLHAPTLSLLEASRNGHTPEYASLATDLFGLEDDPTPGTLADTGPAGGR